MISFDNCQQGKGKGSMHGCKFHLEEQAGITRLNDEALLREFHSKSQELGELEICERIDEVLFFSFTRCEGVRRVYQYECLSMMVFGCLTHMFVSLAGPLTEP
jgi:hypothetical protein